LTNLWMCPCDAIIGVSEGQKQGEELITCPYCKETYTRLDGFCPEMCGVGKNEGVHMGILRPEVIGANRESFPLFRCPKCKNTGIIDLDQVHGRVSVQCPYDGCDYHETKDWSCR